MRVTRLPHFTTLLAAVAALAASACASDPAAASREVLDPHTGTTLTRLEKPVELLSEDVRGTGADPFAYLGPFRTNRMGSYALYLWVAVPVPEDSTPAAPQVTCDAKPLTLKSVEGGLGKIGLSNPPYGPPAPWSRISYYELTESDLDCLRGASEAALTLNLGQESPERFVADRRGLSVLTSFAAQ
jgi:hypothetical protein